MSNVILNIDNIDEFPDYKSCKFCNAIHHDCNRCLKNTHICNSCGKMVYECSICNAEFLTLSSLKKHEQTNKICSRARKLPYVSLENQLKKFTGKN
jgi:hypothetical protein